MYVVTNRILNERATGLNRLGPSPNPQGPNELRVVEATKKQGQWSIEILPDVLPHKLKDEAGITAPDPVYASHYVAHKLLEGTRR